jgi:hypothetical protein
LPGAARAALRARRYNRAGVSPMVRINLLVLSMALAGGAWAQTTAPETYVRVSSRDARYLELSDGSPYIPIGLNMIAPPGASGDPEAALRGMEEWLKSLSSNGGNYIRVWLSDPFWDVEHEKSGVYDAEKAKRIDRLLDLCRKYNIRVKLTMEHFRTIGGGRQRWADKPLHNSANGGPADTVGEFFDKETSRAQFRRKIAWYAARYGNQPIIYGWELWNEINAVSGNGDYMSWTEAMLAELHKAFPKNMAMQSLGSFDSDRWVDLYRRHSLMPGNDVAQVHRYLDLGAALAVCKGPVDALASAAVRELAAFKPGRPIILAESGAVEPNHAGPFKLYPEDREGILLHDILFAPFFSGAAGGGQIWHWDSYVAPNKLWWQYGRFAEAVRGLDPPAEGFEPIVIPQPKLRVYALKGKRTILAWCRDAANTWQSELRDGVKPEQLRGLSVDLTSAIAGTRIATARVYDPWSNQWTSVKVKNGRVTLPPFRRSVVIRAALR